MRSSHPEPHPSRSHAAHAAFAVGDRVAVDDAAGPLAAYHGQAGEVTQAAGPPGGEIYSVRLDAWEKVERPYKDAIGQDKVAVTYRHPGTGAVRDHESDTLGGVPGSSLTKVR